MYQLFYFLWKYFVWFLLELNEIINVAGDVMLIEYGIETEPEPETEPVIETPKKVERYEDKYLTKFNALTKSEAEIETDSINKRFVMDMTPVGNVIMQYNTDKGSFVYYSDNIIPFRYLETVSRKYVCLFNCKELFVERHEVKVQITNAVSIKTKDLMNQKRNPQPLKKEQIEVKMNQYSNAGRFSNFNMLQPVAKHITDKKRLLRFSDFKNTLLKV
jgi:hypothetical protein